jgi:predicted small lipoprotein YifL
LSSKIFLLLLFILIGCGVKKAPRAPGDAVAPSFFDEFTFEEEKKENKKE